MIRKAGTGFSSRQTPQAFARRSCLIKTFIKAFRPPGIRAYIDLAINKPPASARAYSQAGIRFSSQSGSAAGVVLVGKECARGKNRE
jgi:hypothetical protein